LNSLYGLKLKERVYGPTLTLKVCEAAAREQLPLFLFGSHAATLEQLEQNLIARYPNLKIAGRCPSRFRCLSDTEQQSLVAEIISSGARLTLAGIGCPRQEVWAYELRQQLSMPLLAVGAAFAFHAGQLEQAPAWMQQRGLEWFFRLSREPLRLWQRYLVLNPAYVTLWGLQRCRLWTLKSSRGIVPEEASRFG
jgi:exopolysaccharide biosynthesis WecB/TagA/CpsF family protein